MASLSIYKTCQQMVLLPNRFYSVYVWFSVVWFGLAWFINVLPLFNINYGNFPTFMVIFCTKSPVAFLG